MSQQNIFTIITIWIDDNHRAQIISRFTIITLYSLILSQCLHILQHHVRHHFLCLIGINAITCHCGYGCYKSNFHYILFHCNFVLNWY